tara:strand:+ start:7340 stop:7666 length:327 start_codon:yes stop_codon:yes gene_type:complete
MTENDIKTDLGAMTTQDGYEDIPVDELEQMVDDMATQLRLAKQSLREKRLAGVNAAVTARREADAELADELRKLGYPATAAAKLQPFFPNTTLSTTLRNLYRFTDSRF